MDEGWRLVKSKENMKSVQKLTGIGYDSSLDIDREVVCVGNHE
jgi:hypothetical protein